ncbi:MAG: hypothetical protein EBV15_01960 [Bacteroidetes bacterium]|nr:hypothetical protein [Bacteroidota bacterium]
MLKYFKHIGPSAVFTVFIGALILRIPAFTLTASSPEPLNGVVFEHFFNSVRQWPWLSLSLGFLVVFTQAMMFNRLCNEHDVLYTPTFMPAWLFILANSIFPENLHINPLMVSNYFVIGAFAFLFRMHQSERSPTLLFYASALLTLGSFFVTEYLGAPLILLIATVIFKNVGPRDLLAIITGTLIPLGMIWSFHFLTNQQFDFPIPKYNLNIKLDKAILRYVAMTFFFLLTFSGIIKSSLHYFKNNIKTRRINLVSITFFAFAIFIALIKYDHLRYYITIANCGLALFAGYFLLGEKGQRIKGFLHSVLLLLLILSLYGEPLKNWLL